jgi:hypothetical protein
MRPAGELLLVVLGSQNRLRSKPLEDLASNTMNCIFVGPVRVNQADRERGIVDDRLSVILLGKRLSDSELGCAIAHKHACIAAMTALKNQDKIKWALFVEDDADLDGQTLEKIKTELDIFDPKIPSLVTYYSAGNCDGSLKAQNGTVKEPLVVSRHWSSGAVCYAVNLLGLNDIQPFAGLPVDYVADWPVYYSRLRRFVSSQTWVCEVDGPSSVGERVNQQIAKRFVMHVRQLMYLAKLSKLYDLPIRAVIHHLMISPWLRDASSRLQTVKSYLSNSIRG